MLNKHGKLYWKFYTNRFQTNAKEGNWSSSGKMWIAEVKDGIKRNSLLNKRFTIDTFEFSRKNGFVKEKIHSGRERGASHCGSVVQVIGLPIVKIVQGLLFYHGLRFPRYLHQTIIVAGATFNVLDERLPKLLPVISFCIPPTHISSHVPCNRARLPFFFSLSITSISIF